MATSQKTVDFITDQIAQAGDIRSRKMFGEYAIYCTDTVVALVCDDTLFVKITQAGSLVNPKGRTGPPYPGAKPHFIISEDQLEDREWLVKVIRATCQDIPTRKKK